jgi:vesicle-associated membrane protein 7
MTILYALVSVGKTVLAEYTNASGNFPTITRVLLGKIPENEDGKMSYVYDNHVFHYIVDNRMIYLCMCDNEMDTKQRIPYLFLGDIKQRFQSAYGEHAHTAIAFAFNAEFSPILRQRMEYSNNPYSDSITSINYKIDDVKDVMVKNVEMLLERGEKLELLVDKTQGLSQSAFKFERQSRHLKTAIFWRKLKLYFAAALLLLLATWIISSSICGFDYKKCKAR